jgi:hypothetical protein
MASIRPKYSEQFPSRADRNDGSYPDLPTLKSWKTKIDKSSIAL